METNITLALTGDVMLGRGIDQVLRRPGDPHLHEPEIRHAGDYVALAEIANGPIPRPVDDNYVWGDAIAAMKRPQSQARIVNLETSITTSCDFAPKGINYKMNPRNIGCLTAAEVDCCVLANNHVLDWGVAGLLETIATLESAGVRYAGAGRDADEAAAPAIVELRERRLLVFSFGLESSGIPPSWGAGPSRPGVNLLCGVSEQTIAVIADRVRMARRDGDLLIASLHWGGNWGYAIPPEHRILAHRLIDEAGFAVVHGHSSHHPLGIEIHHGRPILYGCGDFITDYEGIAGYEAFRGDLAVLYLPQIAVTDTLASLTMKPFQIRNFRLHQASATDAAWLQATLDRESARLGTRVRWETANVLSLAW